MFNGFRHVLKHILVKIYLIVIKIIDMANRIVIVN